MTLDERKSALLSAIIKEHVKSGESVGSQVLVDKYGFKVSPATIRNEMMALEKAEMVYQPHTSAGRIPTEKGWQYYLEHFLKEKAISPKDRSLLEKALLEPDTYEQKIKSLAKNLAEISREAVIVGFNPDYIYYTGLSNLFRQPEFTRADLIRHISEVIDHLDEVVSRLFKDIQVNDYKIMMGGQNPFGRECSAIVSKFKDKKGETGLFTLLGPVRMAYENNLALLKYSNELISAL